MTTPFDLIQRLSAWFLRADRDVALPSGRKIVITGANVEISGGNLVISGGNITVSGTVDGVDIAAHVADADAHHNWPLADGDIPSSIARDSEVTSSINTHGSDADAHHNWPLADGDIPSSIARDSEVASDIAAHAGDANAHHTWPLTPGNIPALDHGSKLTGLGDDDHSQYHNNARGDVRYYQKSEFASSPGAAESPLKSSSSGFLSLEGLGAGVGATGNDVRANQDISCGNGLAIGSVSFDPTGSCLWLATRSSNPAAPGSGCYIYYYSSGGTIELRGRNSAGTISALATF